MNNLTIVGNLLSAKDIKKIPKNIDAIVHLAANARVYDLVVEPDLALENVVSTYNILEFARKNKIKKSQKQRNAYRNGYNNHSKNKRLLSCRPIHVF